MNHITLNTHVIAPFKAILTRARQHFTNGSPFLISVRFLCHFSMDENHGAVLAIFQIFPHGFLGQLVSLQLILLEDTWLCVGERGGRWRTAVHVCVCVCNINVW